MAECVVYVCNVLLFFVCYVYLVDFAIAENLAHVKPAAEFSRHTLIKAKIYHGREKRQITSTNSGKIGVDFLTVHYDVDDTQHVLDLRLNTQLLPNGYFRKYQKDGKHIIDRPSRDEVDLCHYQGKVRGVEDSWAAISTCQGGLRGVVFDGKELNHIEQAHDDYEGLGDMHYLYKHSDLLETNNKSCGYEGHVHEDFSNKKDKILSRFKRSSNPAGYIRGPYNANKRSRYVELVLVVDNKEYKDLGESLTKVYQHCKDIANIINGLYSSLNIFIALVGVVVWTEHDEIDLSPNGDTTLTNFLHYRREKLIKEHPNDNAQLLTKFVFDRGVVGKALKGPICTFEYSGGVSMDHSAVISLVATTVAHEMGHNFGMEHDTNDCDCPEERCIMAPSSSASWPTHWSSCSLEYLALAFEHGMDYCLRNKPLSLFDSPVCGNGFVEPGEQCDCGLPQTCDNTCCNATTCMLYSNASCATGECCDLKTCRPKTAGSLCRAADYECDLPEYCTGQSEYCPANIYKMDTEDCDGGKAFCYQGSCRTRSDQCKLLWGNTGKSSDDQCYHMNTKGSRHGNCGYHRVNQSFIKCEDANILCGMLHCRHLNERLEFGMESVAILSQSFINLKGSIIPCRTAIVDLGLNQVDPGLAPDGASCGEGKMCVNQKCMSVDSLRAMKNKCPQDCNGNGVCNSLGHCHCKDGFSPPFCDYPGPGGSEDSGPASDPNARKEFVMAMYIVFLGIIPIIAIVAFLMYYTKYNVNFKWQKTGGSTNKSSKSPPKSRNGTAFSESAKRMDDDSSLLQDHQTNFQTEFFGQFKGFRLSPIGTSEEAKQPKRPIPTVPSVPTIPTVTIKNPNRVPRSNNTPIAMVKPTVQATNSNEIKPVVAVTVAGAVVSANTTSVAPALPPLNPGSNPRPLISSPILKASTCTAKELISPLRSAPKVPTRPAPETPENPRPLSSPINASVAIILEDVQPSPTKPKETNSALNRIASFLKPKEDKNKSQTSSPSATQNTAKLNKNIDKNALRTIEISSPIPQNELGLSINALPAETDKNKAVVMRAQSMRGNNVTPRPAIQTFGSMRQPNNAKRPTSIPVGNRPKSPPPPRPPLPEMEPINIVKIPGLPGYQEPNSKPVVPATGKNQYDDCMNEAPLAKISEESPNSGDNIYAVIEENPKSISSGKSSSDSSESVGLLGEIVSEIQNRNFDSIYSTSTLARKKKEALEMELLKSKNGTSDKTDPNDTSETYVNTSSFYKSPESVYSNMGNMNQSSASSTASGYIHPSAVNAPTPKPVVTNDKKNVSPKTSLSTFKNDTKPDISSYKPFSSMLHRNAGPFASTFKSTPVTIDKKTDSTFKSPTSPVDKKSHSIFKMPLSNSDKKAESTIKTPQINSVDKKTESTFKSPTSPVDKKTESIFKTPVSSVDKKAESTFKAPVSNSVDKKIENKSPTSPVDKKEALKATISSPVEKKQETPEVKATEVTSPNSTSKAPKPVGRQVTPVNLRTRKSSPSRNGSTTPKNSTPPKSAKPPATSNSPDLVISCSTTTTSSTKSPDVLNSSAKINNKPNGVLPKPVNITTKTVPTKTVKSPTERKSVGKSPVASKHLNKFNSDANKTTSVSAKIPAKMQPSNVATLQQKFENKTQVAAKTK